MNNNKLLSFLYLTTSETDLLELKEKNQLRFTISQYEMKIILTSLSDDKVELNFIIRTDDNFNQNPSKGDKKIVDLELIKPFIIDAYAQSNLQKNSTIITQVGEKQYQQWLERDLEILKNPYEATGIENIKIDDMREHYYDDRKVIKFQNSQTKVNETIDIINSAKTLENIGFIEIGSSYCAIDNTDMNKPKYTIYYIKYKIPMLELDNYPFLYQHYQLKSQEDTLLSITKKNNNKDLGNILQYINLNESINHKDSTSRKKKI